MLHDSTWLARTRAGRRMRATVPLGALLACVLLAGFASSASASNYDMRGDWTFTFTVKGMTPVPSTLTIETMNAGGEYSGKLVLEDGAIDIPGTVSGTVTGTSLTLNTAAPTPQGTLYFKSTSGALESATHEKVSGEGTYTIEKKPGVIEEIGPGTMVGTQTKDHKEVEEEEERKRREAEEKLARENIRGEWALTLKFGPETTKGIALIKEEANSENKFASSSTIFESVVPGTFSGTLEGGKASVKVTTEAFGQIPPSEFSSNKEMVVTSNGSSMSMVGPGTFTAGPAKVPGELTATRIHTYAEVQTREREAQEAIEAKKTKEAEEARAKEAKEAEEARAKQALEAKQVEEARLKLAREAKERLEREVASKLVSPPLAALVSATPSTKPLTLGGSGSLALALTNPNAYAVQGHITLVAPAARTGRAKGKAKKTAMSFGGASFTLAANGSETVKIKLSAAARADLTRHKSLHVTVTVATNASGMTSVSKVYTITLHAPAHRGKG